VPAVEGRCDERFAQLREAFAANFERHGEVGAALAVTIDREPESDALAELLALAERDCFVGSSLTAEPSSRWSVNGRTIDS